VKPKVLEILQAGRDSLVSEIRQVDLAIETTAAAHGRENEAVNIMLEGRARLQAQIDVLDQTCGTPCGSTGMFWAWGLFTEAKMDVFLRSAPRTSKTRSSI
jgi:hypothetical protein